MAKLYLKFDQKLLREYPLGEEPVTIGRAPDNTILVNDLTVSGHHASIEWKAWRYVVHDKSSLNGTYLNGARVEAADLNNGDEVQLGRHKIVFESDVPEQDSVSEAMHPAEPEAPIEPVIPQPLPEPEPASAKPEPVAVDAPKPVQPTPTTPRPLPPPKPPERIGVLRVIQGKLDESEYPLFSILTVIGKSDTARVQLKGWFAPKVAANITRREGKYVIAPGDKNARIKINGEPTLMMRELREYDTIEVAGVAFTFTYREK